MSLQGTSTLVTAQSGGDLALADGGYFYKCIATTPGTGIIGPVSTTLDETKALLSIYNTHATKNIYLRFLRLHVQTVGTTGSIVQFTQAIDPGTNRYSGGTSALTPMNTNSASANETHANVFFGALTTAAASTNRRLTAHTKFKSAIEVVDDTYQFTWGAASQFNDPASLINNTTTLSHVSYSFEPVCIAPGASFLLHQWRASITVGVTFDVELGYVLK